jgi:acyl dehydratase
MSNSSYPTLFDVWTETSSRMFDSVMEANRAAMDAFAAPGTNGDHSEDGTEDRVEPAGDLPGWETRLDVDGDLSVGDSVRFSKRLSEEDVERFATASGDTNPLHLDEEWAEDTRFGGRIVHGTLAAGLISAALARLPGGVVYLSQDLEFRAPVRIDDRVTADVEIVEDLGGGRYRLRTTVETEADLVIDGEAVVLIED